MLQQFKIYFHALLFAWNLRLFYNSISGMINHASAMGSAMSGDVKIPETLGQLKQKVRR